LRLRANCARVNSELRRANLGVESSRKEASNMPYQAASTRPLAG